MITGDIIKKLRLQNNLTQEELGEIIGVKKSAIAKYESGRVENLKRSSIEKLANYFDVSPAYLLGMDTENDQDIYFSSAADALKFILEQPIFASNVGYDPKKMTDEQLIKLANKILRFTKMEVEDMEEIDPEDI